VLLVFGTLLALALKSDPAVAQVAVSPSAIEVTVPAGEQVTRTLTVTGEGSKTLALALSLAPAPSAADPPGEPGDVLFTSEEVDGNPASLTTLPGGYILAADTRRDFFVFDEDLNFIQEFEHDVIEFASFTLGVAYRPVGPEGGTLWWMDVVRDCDGPDCTIEHALLLEGDLDGNATGRQLTVPTVEDPGCSSALPPPQRLAYAADSGRFFWLDAGNDTIWAMDTLGVVAEGYPVAYTDYAGVPQPENPEGCLINRGIDAHVLSNEAGAPGEPLLETVTGYPFVHPANRAYTAVVTDRAGRNRGAETPLFDLEPPDGKGVVLRISDVARSRTDPSVLYLVVNTGFLGPNNRDWIYAVRAAPLPPVWLHASPILFSVEGESERDLTLTLDASGLEPGVYEGVASVREGDGIGDVLAEVPVTLTVTEGTDAEDEAAEPEASSLAVYPNPSHDRVTVALSLDAASEVRVAVYDVLGREFAVLHEGPLTVGNHEWTFEGRGLPSGLYLVRASAGREVMTTRLTLLR
jgi:hypothetical protein